jgi:hypothetical protein
MTLHALTTFTDGTMTITDYGWRLAEQLDDSPRRDALKKRGGQPDLRDLVGSHEVLNDTL